MHAALVVARLVADESELAGRVGGGRGVPVAGADGRVHERRPGADLVRLAAANDADLVLVDAPRGPRRRRVLPPSLAELLERSPAHVAVLVGRRRSTRRAASSSRSAAASTTGRRSSSAPGSRSATGAPLRLVGTRADPRSGRRDASRLLADASLAVQRVVDVDAAPVLADPDGLVDAVADAGLVVVGISPRWRDEGIGATRRALVRERGRPCCSSTAARGPGLLAPRESRTRFTWTLD